MADSSTVLGVDRLRQLVDAGEVDTVLVAFTDLQGRLQGKRTSAVRFLADLGSGTPVGEHLLAVDVDMRVAETYPVQPWDRGWGEFLLRPVAGTLRPVSWLPATALVLCDVLRPDGTAVRHSPRQLLAEQVGRLSAQSLEATAGAELEFAVFDETFDGAWRSGYGTLTRAGRYPAEHSLLGSAHLEPLLRDIRIAAAAGGASLESVRSAAAPGQHALTLAGAPALRAADDLAVVRLAAKEIAAQAGRSLTFMARVDEAAGNACHLWLDVRAVGPGAVGFTTADGERTQLFSHFVAGVLETLRDFSILYAPNVNSYKRFGLGGQAPTAVAWGEDNRTCALRVVSTGGGLRLENRVPGADANPYVALAAMLAGGLHGVESQLPLDPPLAGDARLASRSQLPRSLDEARDLFATSQIARLAFGDDVVDHYLHAADVELAAFADAVTDWERRRGFERL